MMITKIMVIIIFFAFIIMGFLMIEKFKPKRVKICKLFTIIVALLVSALIPPFAIEKVYMTFDNPESALMYYEDKDTVDVVVKAYGKESCMMRFYNGTVYGFGFSRKTDDGWKLVPLYFDSYRNIYSENFGNKSIHVYHVKGTQDYYVNVSTYSTDNISVSDNNETIFQTYSDSKIKIYMGYVYNLEEEYMIIVGEETIKIA